MTFVSTTSVNAFLDEYHYLGAVKRGFAWEDELGVLVLAPPTSRRMPTTWLELTRWCLVGTKNGGSMQWARVVRALREEMPSITTIVSYSDPSVGHTGALYRACNWAWAPTWHRLRPPPTGNGSWTKEKIESTKDRWVFPLRRDAEREEILAVRDDALRKRFPFAEYREPRFKRSVPVLGTGGGDYARWLEEMMRLARADIPTRSAVKRTRRRAS